MLLRGLKTKLIALGEMNWTGLNPITPAQVTEKGYLHSKILSLKNFNEDEDDR